MEAKREQPLPIARSSADEGVPGTRSVTAAAQISNAPLAGELWMLTISPIA